MAAIVRRMEERAGTRGSDGVRKTAADGRKLNCQPDDKQVKELRKDSDNSTTSTKTPIEIRDALKKLVSLPQDTTDMAQRSAAI